MVVKLPKTGSDHPATLPKQVSVWSKKVDRVFLIASPLMKEDPTEPVLFKAVSLDGLSKLSMNLDSVTLSEDPLFTSSDD